MNDTNETTGEQDREPQQTRRPTDRSPNYPIINLEEAIERARKFWDRERRNTAPASVAVAHWGFSPKSSGGRMTLSALVKFGLLEESGRGAERYVKLSPLAFDVLLDERPDSEERADAIRRAALSPTIHADLWEKWGRDLPSDASMRTYLVKDLEFTDSGATGLIREYKETIGFAKLTVDDHNVPEKDRKPVGDSRNAHAPLRGESIAQPAPKPREFASAVHAAEPQAPPARRKPMQSGIKEDVFTLEEGQVVLQWPERLSPESFEDFESWLKLVIRKAKRSVQRDGELTNYSDPLERVRRRDAARSEQEDNGDAMDES